MEARIEAMDVREFRNIQNLLNLKLSTVTQHRIETNSNNLNRDTSPEVTYCLFARRAKTEGGK